MGGKGESDNQSVLSCQVVMSEGDSDEVRGPSLARAVREL